MPPGEAGLKALPDRDIVACLQADEQPVWCFERDAVGAAVTVRLRYGVQDLERCRDACVSGLCLALLPDYLCENFEAEGALRRLFPGWSAPPAMLVASSDAGRSLTREARRFVNFFRPGGTIVPLPARVGSA